MQDYTNTQWTAATCTTTNYKYDYYTDKILDLVRGAKTEKEAVHNLKILLKDYANDKIERLSVWELIKLILNK